ncbi:hypothetical protein BDW59DRAFT_181276 [Aspergillus cavernicola]|uniref:25S rRNA (Uridine(2843)-N(3))-methyltransferase n=1 Tax=Aspergillus cavernicola TaxID=176166 RepID=A0ABR4I0H9_9EURO
MKMAPPKSKPPRKSSKDTHSREGKTPDKKALPRRKAQDQQQQQRQPKPSSNNESQNGIDISHAIPLNLQQLVLNVFKTALLPSRHDETGEVSVQSSENPAPAPASTEGSLDIKSLIQTIKSHLYNRDFDSAFADADEELLRAYALRWSATRALGYAGLFKSLLKGLVMGRDDGSDVSPGLMGEKHVVCIGGGAGAEIVALAAAWRDLMDEEVVPVKDRSGKQKDLSDALDAVSLDNKTDDTTDSSLSNHHPGLSVTAIDIADWSSVVNRLSSTIQSPTVQSWKSHTAPLLPGGSDTARFEVNFKRLDVLSLPDPALNSLFHSPKSDTPTALVTLMFTLNELFSTSMSKATAFLLRITDLLQPGTILLVVDSPGSYSTLKLGKCGDAESAMQERQYPMKFLLDHTLLSVAKGKWERMFSQDSRWWRRDAARLWYDVGEGAGLEDMRFQIHVYRRV